MYDFDKIDILADYYINLCNKYNKFVCVEHFGKMINIKQDTNDIFDNKYDINNNNLTDEGIKVLQRFNTLRTLVRKKIVNDRDLSIITKCYDNNNVSGAIALGNNYLGWNNNSSNNTQVTNNYITMRDLPNFGALEQKK